MIKNHVKIIKHLIQLTLKMKNVNILGLFEEKFNKCLGLLGEKCEKHRQSPKNLKKTSNDGLSY